jgi:hypothetical protein
MAQEYVVYVLVCMWSGMPGMWSGLNARWMHWVDALWRDSTVKFGKKS